MYAHAHSYTYTPRSYTHMNTHTQHMILHTQQPKLHDKPYGSRFIAASSCCSTTIDSKVLTACFGLVNNANISDAVYRSSGLQGLLIKNSHAVSEVVSELN